MHSKNLILVFFVDKDFKHPDNIELGEEGDADKYSKK